MYSSNVSAEGGKTFTASHSERAVHWEEDIKEQAATVGDVTKVHGHLHHLSMGQMWPVDGSQLLCNTVQ